MKESRPTDRGRLSQFKSISLATSTPPRCSLGRLRQHLIQSRQAKPHILLARDQRRVKQQASKKGKACPGPIFNERRRLTLVMADIILTA